MKKTLLFMSFLLAINLNAQTGCLDLFFSEYVEGWSQNKAIEIYNPTDQTVNLSDYQVERYSNGATNSSAGGITALTGMLASGDVFVLTNGETDTSSTFGFCDPALIALGDMAEPSGSYPTPMHMNGNDAIVLTKNGEIIDVIGRVGEDPASGAWTCDTASGFTTGSWWTAQHTLIRKNTVLNGDDNGVDLFNPSAEWDSLPVGTWNNLGSHSCNCLVVIPTWDCDGQGNCIDPGTGQGTYASLAACESNCIAVTPTWDCDVQGNCTDPGTGQGTYASLIACENNCTQTSINETDTEVLIYPMPANIGNTVIVTAISKIENIDVINILGEKVLTVKSNKINTNELVKGLYMIIIHLNNGKMLESKVIIK